MIHPPPRDGGGTRTRIQNVKRFAATTAILGCLVLALIAMSNGVPAIDCVLRAIGGAVAIYFVVSIAGRIVLNIFVDAVVNHAADRGKAGDIDGDNAG